MASSSAEHTELVVEAMLSLIGDELAVTAYLQHEVRLRSREGGGGGLSLDIRRGLGTTRVHGGYSGSLVRLGERNNRRLCLAVDF